MRRATVDYARCSFCHKSEDVVEYLIPSPADPNIHICNECLAVCNSILSDQSDPPDPPPEPEPGRLLMCDPRTQELLNTIEHWVIAESANRHAPVLLERASRLALSMMRLHSG